VVVSGALTENPAGSPKVAPQREAAEQREFERFEDLTRALVQVPKDELDEKRKRA
jgi:hypothetical protein